MLVTASYSLASSMLGTDNKKNQFRNKKIKKLGKRKWIVGQKWSSKFFRTSLCKVHTVIFVAIQCKRTAAVAAAVVIGTTVTTTITGLKQITQKSVK